jgi:hypothetical protein
MLWLRPTESQVDPAGGMFLAVNQYQYPHDQTLPAKLMRLGLLGMHHFFREYVSR